MPGEAPLYAVVTARPGQPLTWEEPEAPLPPALDCSLIGSNG